MHNHLALAALCKVKPLYTRKCSYIITSIRWRGTIIVKRSEYLLQPYMRFKSKSFLTQMRAGIQPWGADQAVPSKRSDAVHHKATELRCI